MGDSLVNDPISNCYGPIFRAMCCRCGAWRRSDELATGAEPFTYVGPECQDTETRDRVRAAANVAFRNLRPHEQHVLRVHMFGRTETRRIEVRAGTV
jgi:hypothetical protein